MRVLIVGCGYVGRALGAALVRQGHDVFGLRRSTLANDALRRVGIQPVPADITRPETLTALPRNFDWVVNCAAAGSGSVADYRRVYLAGTRNLLAWLASVPPRKFVYTSSTGVYGQNDGSRVTEASPTAPQTETGRVLVETERELLAAARQRNFRAVILRVAGIYGPGRGFHLRALLRGAARMEGEGRRWVNLIHRDDVVGAILAGLKRGQPGTVYNVCDDEPARQREVYAWLAQQLHLPLPATVSEDPEASRQRGATHKRVANQRLLRELGYTLKYPTFRDGYAAQLARLASSDASETGLENTRDA